MQDPDQLRALADLGDRLTTAADRDAAVDVLLDAALDGLGAFAGAVGLLCRDGLVRVQHVGLGPAVPAEAVALADRSPLSEVVRTGALLLLGRADAALRFPDLALPARIGGLAVLPLGVEGNPEGAWLLAYDGPLPGDRTTRAMFEVAARLASAAVRRTRPA